MFGNIWVLKNTPRHTPAPTYYPGRYHHVTHLVCVIVLLLTAASYSEARSSMAQNSAPRRWGGVVLLENLAKNAFRSEEVWCLGKFGKNL